MHGGEVYVTVCSDHTDRAAERLDIALSKRACHKVIGSAAWRLEDVAARWDDLRVRSWIGTDASSLYQDGTLGALLPPRELLAAVPWREEPACYVLLCGTVPTIGGIRRARASAPSCTTPRPSGASSSSTPSRPSTSSAPLPSSTPSRSPKAARPEKPSMVVLLPGLRICYPGESFERISTGPRAGARRVRRQAARVRA